jgi:acetyl-CoA C-acetyltransferase
VNGCVVLDRDEHMRADTTLASLAKLEPAFKVQGEKYGFDAVARQR